MIDKNLFQKYLSNTCSTEELEEIKSWFCTEALYEENRKLVFDIWENLPEPEKEMLVDHDLILDRIHHRANLESTKRILFSSHDNIRTYSRRKVIFRFILHAAAVLLIPVTIFGTIMTAKYLSLLPNTSPGNIAYNEIFSSVDAITKVTLPDGSRVWLNHRSSLKYPMSFIGKTRNVELTGEGYFEVAKNPKVLFVVKSGDIQVVAKGTTFNIAAYPEEGMMETTLLTGKVDIQSSDGLNTPLYTMKPDEKAIMWNGTNEIIINKIKDRKMFAWKDGLLIFENEPLALVVRKLGRWFNADINIADNKLYDLSFTAKFSNESLYQVLELLSLAIPVRYNISDRRMLEDGTFSKRIVTLRHK
jgi:transmembrane sensor